MEGRLKCFNTSHGIGFIGPAKLMTHSVRPLLRIVGDGYGRLQAGDVFRSSWSRDRKASSANVVQYRDGR